MHLLRIASRALFFSVSTIAALAVPGTLGCSKDEPSSLVGSMRLTIDDGTGTPLSLSQDGPPAKVRAQIDDNGSAGCVFDSSVESEDSSFLLQINTYPDEVTALLAGQSQSIAASDNHTRSIVLNGATIYITSGKDNWYTTGGTLSVAALPAVPKNNVHIDVDVTVARASDNVTGTMKGTIDATYIGAVRTASTHACPAIPDVPAGIIY